MTTALFIRSGLPETKDDPLGDRSNGGEDTGEDTAHVRQSTPLVTDKAAATEVGKIVKELRETPAQFPLKRARLIRCLREKHGLTVKRIAQMWGKSEQMMSWLGRIWKLPEGALCFFEDSVPEKHRLAVNAAHALLRKFPNDPERLVEVARIMSEQNVFLKTACRLNEQEALRSAHAEQPPEEAAPTVGSAPAVAEARPSADPLREILQALDDARKALRRIADFPLHVVEDVLSLDGGQATAVDRLQVVAREVQILLGLVQKNPRPEEVHPG